MGGEKPVLILLSGWAGSGKDAVAAILTEHHGFKRFAFADPLKKAVAEATGLPAAMFERPFKDRPLSASDPRTPRELLITHADAARAVEPDIYSRAIVANIQASGIGKAVISDWRYRREGAVVSDALVAAGWRILRIRIERPGVIPSSAPIEHDLDSEDMDYRIQNDGTLSDLNHTIEQIYGSLIQPGS
jgi:hypothetical protein